MEYYTPKIEDLFIGYEFEQSSEGRPGYPDWLPNCKVEDGDDIEFIRTREWIIRTSYLTKEQIEKEGWVYNTLWEGIHKLKKENYGMDYNSKEHCIRIAKLEHHNILFEGNCPSINEFRKICKLLEI